MLSSVDTTSLYFQILSIPNSISSVDCKLVQELQQPLVTGGSLDIISDLGPSDTEQNSTDTEQNYTDTEQNYAATNTVGHSTAKHQTPSRGCERVDYSKMKQTPLDLGPASFPAFFSHSFQFPLFLH